MSEQTSSTKGVESNMTTITIGGTKVEASIEGLIYFTYTRYPAQNMSGRMEDAIPSDEEVTLDSVDLTVTLYEPTVNAPYIQFETTSIDFYEEHFGELDCMDVVGYV